MRHHPMVRIFKFVLFAALAAAAFSFVVMSLWNWLMPAIFGLKTINYWQAFGLLILSWIFFGRFRGGHHWHGRRWRRRMFERWERMTPEEREHFRQKMRSHRGHHHDVPPTSGNAA